MIHREKIKKSLYSDIEFMYKGKSSAFCPVDAYWVRWGQEARAFPTLDQAISAPIFDGKSLVEIWEEVYPQITYCGDL